MALSVELLVFRQVDAGLRGQQVLLVRALLAAMSSAVITETATGSVAASEGTRCAVTVMGLSSVGAGSLLGGGRGRRGDALRRRVRAFICMTSKRPATPGHSRWEDAARPAGKGAS